MAKATIPAAEAEPTRVQIASSGGALKDLEDDWRRLAEARGNAFVTPDWFQLWRRHYDPTAEPAVVAVHGRGDSLVGLLPLIITRHGRRSVLRFAGANIGDCFHPVTIPSHEEEVAIAAWDALAACSETPKVMILERAENSGDWIDSLGSRAPGLVMTQWRRSPLPYIQLPPEGWEHYLAARSRNFRNQVRRKERNLEREQGLRFRSTQTEAELERDLETFFELHEARWQSRGGSGALTDNSRAFHRDFSRVALARGWLRLWVLELNGEPAGAWYGWRIGPRYSYYLAGFSPRWSKGSVGFVLLAHTIRSAFEEEATEYDLLLGGEDYKARFATDSREVQTVALGPRTNPFAMQLRAEAGLWRIGTKVSPSIRARAASVYQRISLSDKR